MYEDGGVTEARFCSLQVGDLTCDIGVLSSSTGALIFPIFS